MIHGVRTIPTDGRRGTGALTMDTDIRNRTTARDTVIVHGPDPSQPTGDKLMFPAEP
ncbi:hypothetical protein OS128_01260 [Corynebacterium sp. P5848]|uniref:hypothetical protein n=1 Tax=Corynebacterium marambiense TaxID=2765364 RepID=UPI00226103B5|nr:hypothetical protein [Corynebacterium marambiense]MCX7541549.1 hypothetical protein [Corynebacterium marambiense]